MIVFFHFYFAWMKQGKMKFFGLVITVNFSDKIRSDASISKFASEMFLEIGNLSNINV